MEKINDNTKKYMELFHNPSFTEHEFVAVLLSLLCKNGIRQIDEAQLIKKLYYYYQNNDYQELFQDIALTRGSFDNQVDIQDGLYREKYFSGNIFWDSMRGTPLNLRYDINEDLLTYEQGLSEDGKLKIRKMAEELSIRKKVEQKSKFPLNIYGVNPNQVYILVHGRSLTDILSFELLTDGEIEKLEYKKSEGDGKYYYESPMYPNEYRTLKDNKVLHVNLKNASFAIRQGLCNEDIRYNIINTNIINSDELEKLMNMANQRYGSDTLMTEEAPFVRKITLK